MSLLPEGLRGSQRPRFERVPLAVSSEGPDAAYLAGSYGGGEAWNPYGVRGAMRPVGASRAAWVHPPGGAGITGNDHADRSVSLPRVAPGFRKIISLFGCGFYGVWICSTQYRRR
jgi:hypothetical protein